MKPAPAISTLASGMARLLAKSPCCASRVFSTSMPTLRAAAGTADSGRAASACVSNSSIKVFKANPRVRSTKGRQFTAIFSVYFQWIHVDRPAQAGDLEQRLHLGQPFLEEALQRGPRGGLDEQMRAIVIGAPCNQGAGGPPHVARP